VPLANFPYNFAIATKEGSSIGFMDGKISCQKLLREVTDLPRNLVKDKNKGLKPQGLQYCCIPNILARYS